MTIAEIAENCTAQENTVVGFEYKENCEPAKIGKNAAIRTGTIIYGDVEIGDDFKTGHFVLIREQTRIGNNVLVGSNTVIDGHCTLGSNIKLQTGVYLSTHTVIGNNVFIGPHAVLLNDKYPVRMEYVPRPPIIEDDVSIGGNATILPGVRIGKGAFVAAGAVVTRDVPEGKLALGNPAQICDLPEQLKGRNRIA